MRNFYILVFTVTGIFIVAALVGCASISGLLDITSDTDNLYHSGQYKKFISRLDSEYPPRVRQEWVEEIKRHLIEGKTPPIMTDVRYYFYTPHIIVALIESGNIERARMEVDKNLSQMGMLETLSPQSNEYSLHREAKYRLLLYKAYINWKTSGDKSLAFREVNAFDLKQLDPIPKIWFSLERAFFQEKILGDYVSALASLRYVLLQTQQLGWSDMDSKFAYSMQAYRRMAWIQMKLGRLSDAKATLDEYQSETQDIRFKFGKGLLGSAEYFRGYLSMMDSTAGAIFAVSRDFEQAKRFFDSAKDILDTIPIGSDHIWDRNAWAAYHVLYGAYYLGLHGRDSNHNTKADYRQAAQSIEKGITYLRPSYIDAIQNEIDIESAYLQSAEFNFLSKNYSLARDRASQSLDFAHRYWNIPVSASAHILLGILNYEEGNIGTAKTELEKARLAIDRQENSDNWKLYHWLGKINEKVGRIDESLRYYLQSVNEVEKLWDGRFSDVMRQLSFIDERLIVYEPAILGQLRANKPAETLTLVEKAKARSFYYSKSNLNGSMETAQETIAGEPLDYNKIKESLPEDTALIEYYVGNKSVVVFSLNRASGLVGKVLAVSPNDLKDKVFKFYESISDMNNTYSDCHSKNKCIYNDIGYRLYNDLIKPVEKNLLGQQRLRIIPHGVLHYLPFHALPEQKDETLYRPTDKNVIKGLPINAEALDKNAIHYLAERYAIYYAPSSTILALVRSTHNIIGRNSLFAIGNPPEVDTHDLPFDPPQDKLNKLSFAEEEMMHVGRLFSQYMILSDKKATETAAKQYIPKFNNILISSHAAFFPNRSTKSTIFLAPDDYNDGRLTIAEIEQIKIHANLVVLSACQTAVAGAYFGNSKNEVDQQNFPLGDDLTSLQRAFIRSGAASIISTMWNAKDKSTKEFISYFFSRYRSGDSKLDALRNTQLHFIKSDQWHHPYFWAPFVLSGDWDH